MGERFGRGFSGHHRLRRDRERLVFVGAAGLAFALLVLLIGVFNFRSDVSARSDAVPRPLSNPGTSVSTVSLLAPDQPVRAGTRLSEVRFKEVFWPRNQVPDQAMRDPAELRTLYARVDLAANIPIQRTQLTTEGRESTTLALTPRNRAVSIEVDETSGLEGHALPGTKVDVVLTFFEDERLVSKVIVQNARVLSYGGDATNIADRSMLTGESGARRMSRTITLDVSPKDALQIATARQLGRLSLLMRSSDDDVGVAVDMVTQDDIRDGQPRRSDSRGSCRSGRMRMGNREYVVDCDGSISEVMDPNEP